jgi:hypothetical protein
MILQNSSVNPYDLPINFSEWIFPFIEFFFIIFLLCLMGYLYKKMRIWVMILLVFTFSLIFGIISIMRFDIPFSPYIQIFFILFQTIIFLSTSIEVFKS